MIKSVAGVNKVIVSGDCYLPPYVNMSNPSAGIVRYNGNSGNMEVYDGAGWQPISDARPIIDLSLEANSAIDWVLTKMAEEAELEKLSKKHPSVKAAYENMKRAEQQLKTTIILSKDESTTN